MRSISKFLCFLLLATPVDTCFALGGGKEDSRKALPDDIDLDVARARVRKLFKTEYADDSSAGRKDLAQRLRDHAAEETKDVALRFALLDEARDIAAQAGEVSAALKSLQNLAGEFRIDPLPLQRDTLSALPRRLAPDPALIATMAWFDHIHSLLVERRLSDARSACTEAKTVLGKARVRSLQRSLSATSKTVSALYRDRSGIQSAFRAIEAKTAAARHFDRAGRYYCFSVGAWDRGLALLSKGTDTTLAGIARLELKNPERPSDQENLAQAWESFAKSNSKVKAQALTRARRWYGEAYLKQTGVSATHTERRLAELSKFEGSALGAARVGKADLRVRVWDAPRWRLHPPSRMELSGDWTTFDVRNSSTEHWQAHLVYRLPLVGNFTAYLEIRGGRRIGLVAANGADKVVSIVGTPDWQTVVIRRSGPTITFTSDGEPAESRRSHDPSPTMRAMLVVAINENQSCSIRNLRIFDAERR